MHEGHGSSLKITLAGIFHQMFLAITSIVTISNSLRWTNCKILFFKKTSNPNFMAHSVGLHLRPYVHVRMTCLRLLLPVHSFLISPPPPASSCTAFFVCVCQRVQIWLLNPALLISSLPPALLPWLTVSPIAHSAPSRPHICLIFMWFYFLWVYSSPLTFMHIDFSLIQRLPPPRLPLHMNTHTRLPMHTQAEVHKSKHQTGSFHRQKCIALIKSIPAFSSHTNSYCKTKHSCLVVSRQFEMLTSLKSSVSSTEITKLQPGNSEEVR